VELFACIRTGDIATLNRRFGIPATKCFFVHFPANCVVADADIEPTAGEAPYIYSAGAAHRDWQTLIDALKMLDYRAILSPGFAFKAPDALPERIEILPPQPPEDGRQLLRKAHLAVLSLKDTDLPSGPLVLLDAMSMGKPVIASRVNGTLDYIIDGETGILVSPNNPGALAKEIQRLMEDPELAIRIGADARKAAVHKFTNKQFIDAIMAKCESLAPVPQ
jgi:glycosyltransferase involved in cell wall biosynthesis